MWVRVTCIACCRPHPMTRLRCAARRASTLTKTSSFKRGRTSRTRRIEGGSASHKVAAHRQADQTDISKPEVIQHGRNGLPPFMRHRQAGIEECSSLARAFKRHDLVARIAQPHLEVQAQVWVNGVVADGRAGLTRWAGSAEHRGLRTHPDGLGRKLASRPAKAARA